MLNEEMSGGGTPRCWKTSDGRLWLLTSQGAVVLDPRMVTNNATPPSVILEDAWIENRPVSMAHTITMHPGETKIELGFTAIGFAAPGKIHFRYRLQGFDKEWNDVGTGRLARYTNLDPGEYLFRVTASNNAGAWNEDGASVKIVVLPPYYVTWWFRGIIVLVVIALVSLIFYVRITQLTHARKRQEELSKLLIQNQEDERKRIALELHDSVGQKILLIKNQLTAKIRKEPEESSAASLQKISDLTSETLQEIRTISQNLRPQHLDQLGLTTAIETLVEKVQESSAIRFHLHVDEITGVIPPDKEINFFRIVQEGLNNIVKHSCATDAFVTITHTDEMIRLEIRDNGSCAKSADSFARGGLGLTGMKERARMIGATLSIQLPEGAGCCITLEYPMLRNAQ
jgi:signal transduction histidine kinase